jgi:hypothetical protein
VVAGARLTARDAGGQETEVRLPRDQPHFMLGEEMPHGGLQSAGCAQDSGLYALDDYTVPRHVMITF